MMFIIKVLPFLFLFGGSVGAQMRPTEVKVARLSIQNPISCAVFRHRMEESLTRLAELDLLFAVKKGNLNSTLYQRLAGVLQRSHLPMPSAEDRIQVTAHFVDVASEFDWSHFKYRVRTGYFDFNGEAPFYLHEMELDHQQEVTTWKMSLPYVDACLNIADLQLELQDASGRQKSLLIPASHLEE